MTQPPIYVINLDRSPARLAHMTRSLGALGLPFERIVAVDGRTLAPEVVASSPLGPGEHGCFLSHRAAWQRLAERGAPLGYVLEDDVIAHPSFADLVQAGPVMPPRFDVMKLDTTWHPVRLTRPVGRAAGFEFRALRSVHWCTAGYALTRAAALQLLEETAASPPCLASDGYLYLPAGHERRVQRGAPPPQRIVQCVPAPLIAAHRLVADPALASTLSAEREPAPSGDRIAPRRRSRRLAARIAREVVRPARRLARGLRRHTVRALFLEKVRVPFADGTTERWADGRPVRPGLDPRRAPDTQD